MARFTRRKFLQASGAGLAGILASHQAPVFAQQQHGALDQVERLRAGVGRAVAQVDAAGGEKALGIKINLETVNGNDLQPRVTSAIQSGTGPDIIMLFNNNPQIYGDSAVDVGDVAEAIGKAQGGYYNVAKANTNDGKKWLAGAVGASSAP